jgi:hypothetical protein
VLEAKLGKRLASLLFAARVHADTRPRGDALAVGVVVVVAVVVAGVRVVRVRVGFFDRGLVAGRIVVEDFFDFGHLLNGSAGFARNGAAKRASIHPSPWRVQRGGRLGGGCVDGGGEWIAGGLGVDTLVVRVGG